MSKQSATSPHTPNHPWASPVLEAKAHFPCLPSWLLTTALHSWSTLLSWTGLLTVPSQSHSWTLLRCLLGPVADVPSLQSAYLNSFTGRSTRKQKHSAQPQFFHRPSSLRVFLPVLNSSSIQSCGYPYFLTQLVAQQLPNLPRWKPKAFWAAAVSQSSVSV